MHGIPIPDTRPFRRNFVSRLLARFPFAMEIIYWLLTYLPYQLIRAISALRINATPEHKALVTKRMPRKSSRSSNTSASRFELRLQRYILGYPPVLMTLRSDVYLAHISIGIAFLACGYTCLPRARYTALRRSTTCSHSLSSPSGGARPRVSCPPPSGSSTSSTPGAPSAWANNRFLAAMPSLHFGTAVPQGSGSALWGRHA
ncbi:hypothetical protein C8F04DRAFT_952216 [Mycena alexandri]|uniref:Uncharacterized protein n=1 Tax=Mycena alexandri TaxID=1745969 RepID=A0AAD6T3F7_9AGAR|nr:hypothetical protein C8F04DRAFT_952216 [Mycena alexandri]